jgi:hypothetical protein
MMPAVPGSRVQLGCCWGQMLAAACSSLHIQAGKYICWGNGYKMEQDRAASRQLNGTYIIDRHCGSYV